MTKPRAERKFHGCEAGNWQASLTRLEGAYADSTLRAYRADIETFENWCITEALSAFPATPETVAAFVSAQSTLVTTATLKRRLAAIRKIHLLLRLDNPIADEDVTIAMRRAMRVKQARPHQALGLTRNLRDRLIASCPATLPGKRDRALIALGYDTLCRRSELVALCAEDIAPIDDEAANILIRRSKTDPYGHGRLGYVSANTLDLLRDWQKAGGIVCGFLFRRVRGERIGDDALHPYSVNRILKDAALRAGLPADTVRELSGHSMRVGAAQDMISSGFGILPIMRAGGWRTMHVVARYVENTDLSTVMRDR